jgi:hypothetical protein
VQEQLYRRTAGVCCAPRQGLAAVDRVMPTVAGNGVQHARPTGGRCVVKHYATPVGAVQAARAGLSSRPAPVWVRYVGAVSLRSSAWIPRCFPWWGRRAYFSMRTALYSPAPDTRLDFSFLRVAMRSCRITYRPTPMRLKPLRSLVS